MGYRGQKFFRLISQLKCKYKLPSLNTNTGAIKYTATLITFAKVDGGYLAHPYPLKHPKEKVPTKSKSPIDRQTFSNKMEKNDDSMSSLIGW